MSRDTYDKVKIGSLNSEIQRLQEINLKLTKENYELKQKYQNIENRMNLWKSNISKLDTKDLILMQNGIEINQLSADQEKKWFDQIYKSDSSLQLVKSLRKDLEDERYFNEQQAQLIKKLEMQIIELKGGYNPQIIENNNKQFEREQYQFISQQEYPYRFSYNISTRNGRANPNDFIVNNNNYNRQMLQRCKSIVEGTNTYY